MVSGLYRELWDLEEGSLYLENVRTVDQEENEK